MEKFEENIILANKAFKTADHLTYVTFPLVKDIKLIITIIENLYLSAINCMDALLEYDRLYKRIGPYSDNFEARFEVFKNKSSIRYDVPRDCVNSIGELRNLISSHNKSPMEFVRKDQFVICSSNYQMKTINIDKIKDYLVKLKSMINLINNIKKEMER
jgi:hypothetical protein